MLFRARGSDRWTGLIISGMFTQTTCFSLNFGRIKTFEPYICGVANLSKTHLPIVVLVIPRSVGCVPAAEKLLTEIMRV